MKDATNLKVKELYDFIKAFQRENGYPPTVREIQRNFSIRSTASVSYYLALLEKDGLIRRSKQKNRSIEIVGESKACDVPLVGDIAAGVPILATENIDSYFPLPDGYFGKGAELFLLKIRGSSMIDVGIQNGDIVVIRRQETAENGEIAAVLIENEATLKRFYKENGHFRLKPENSAMDDIITENAEILGVLVGLIRRY